MENGGDRRSEAVCSRFADRLPIRYLFRQPGLTPLEHGRLIMREACPCRHIAILHDDDWWGPEHLLGSLHALETNGAAACYSASFDVSDERPPQVYDGTLMFSLAGGFQPATRDWVLDLASVLVGTLPGTPGRFSTLVAKAGAFRQCAHALDHDNDYDNDRMLGVALARQGVIVYRPVPSVFVRTHAGQDGRRFSDAKQFSHSLKTTVWLFAVARESRIDLMRELATRLDACPEAGLQAVLVRLSIPYFYQLMRPQEGLPRVLLDFWKNLERAQAPAEAAKT